VDLVLAFSSKVVAFVRSDVSEYEAGEYWIGNILSCPKRATLAR